MADPRRKARLGQQPCDRIRKGLRLVLDQNVASGYGLDALGAKCGGDDGLAHRHRLDDFQPGAAAKPQRHDDGGGFCEMRPQVRHEAGEFDSGSVPAQATMAAASRR